MKPHRLSPWISLCLLANCLTLLANLPPSAYEAMQAQAGEALAIEVLRVETEPTAKLDEEIIRAIAVVTTVERTASGLQPGDSIEIVYRLRMGGDGQPLTGQPPRLEDGFKGPAFLQRSEDAPIYQPAAADFTFERF